MCDIGGISQFFPISLQAVIVGCYVILFGVGNGFPSGHPVALQLTYRIPGTVLFETQTTPPAQVSRHASFMFSFLGRGICNAPTHPRPFPSLTSGSLHLHWLDPDPRWVVACDCRHDHWTCWCCLRFVPPSPYSLHHRTRVNDVRQRDWNSYPLSSRHRVCAIHNGIMIRFKRIATIILPTFWWGTGLMLMRSVDGICGSFFFSERGGEGRDICIDSERCRI